MGVSSDLVQRPTGPQGNPAATTILPETRLPGNLTAREGWGHSCAKPSQNSAMGPDWVVKSCPLDDAARNLLRAAMRRLDLSARGYHRVLKVGRTIADLAGSERIHVAHLAEAVQYRPPPYTPA